ncbi:hypothetical protein JAAARDRAFT_35646 [Jaapia argillacea MUCL 33604]|uniref:GTP-binding protein n=1 Tax=Jaapia argillacea MUCL 33604 TaxID=933084 RepID=A0A067PT67_9AGAM|nr:hypothetical protein JAAARDRAFT_35646 [Jaapia argillacea MUCL 33604]
MASTSSNGNGSIPDNVIRTKILLTGMRRSGKTSIHEVLFNNMQPKDTFWLETTTRVRKHHYDTVIPLEIWDCPWNAGPETLEISLVEFAAMIFVIDIQDLYQQPIAKLVEWIITACTESPDMSLEVFVHKSEALSEDYKIENFRHIQQRVLDELADISLEYEQVPVNFHLTSVYDHTIHEAFSRVLHKLISVLPSLEDLLNVFCAKSQAPKAFLFDIHSRLYVATDASPVDTATHNLCCDFLSMLNAFGPLYKSVSASPARCRKPLPPSLPTPPPSSPESGHSTSLPSTLSPITPKHSSKELFYPSASTSLSPSAQGTTLTYHLVTPQLALVSILPTTVYESRRGLVEFNVVFFREGVQEICDVELDGRTLRH